MNLSLQSIYLLTPCQRLYPSDYVSEFEKKIETCVAFIEASKKEILSLESKITDDNKWSTKAANANVRTKIASIQKAQEAAKNDLFKLENQLCCINYLIQEKKEKEDISVDSIKSFRDAGFIIYDTGRWAVSASQVLKEKELLRLACDGMCVVVHMPEEIIREAERYFNTNGLSLEQASAKGDINLVPEKYRKLAGTSSNIWNIRFL
jgi:hypothetical protein